MPRVLIPLANGCEELEAVTLIDLLRRADITVITVSLTSQLQITASRGVQLVADTSLDEVLNDEFDLLLLPGGMPGSSHLNDDGRIHTKIKQQLASNKAIGAICAAPMVLAHAGVLAGKTATCYPSVLTSDDWPTINLVNQPVVIDGNILTSQGPGTAIDFALAIIEYLTNPATRNNVEAGLVRPN